MFPESVLSIVREAVKRFPKDPPKSIDWAVGRVKKLPDYEDLVASLVKQAMADLIYDQRHTTTVQIRRSAREYGGPAKVVSGDSPGVASVAESVYFYKIGGTILGEILGKDLRAIGQSERAISNGHFLNARLVEKLATLVPPEKRVRDAVGEDRINKILRNLQRNIGKDAA
jgi:hypothetical protein